MAFPVIITIGGGKGGVGKSIVTVNLGATLAKKGYKVGFIDGDLAGANLHLYLGVKHPAVTLADYLAGSIKTLGELAVPTPLPSTWLISGASGILSLANPQFAQKQKIINHLKDLEADYIFVDLGAGSSSQVVDFFAAFPLGILVCDGLPSSVENAYGFLKNGIVRGMLRLFSGKKLVQEQIQQLTNPRSAQGCPTIPDALVQLAKQYPQEAAMARAWLKQKKTLLILNMVRESADIQVGQRFKEITSRYLGVDLLYAGYVVFSDAVRASARSMTPVAVLDTAPPELVACFTAITENILSICDGNIYAGSVDKVKSNYPARRTG